MNDKLVIFLYILMRDHLPTGTIEAIIHDHVELNQRGLSPTFSAPYLQSYAQQLADRLRYS